MIECNCELAYTKLIQVVFVVTCLFRQTNQSTAILSLGKKTIRRVNCANFKPITYMFDLQFFLRNCFRFIRFDVPRYINCSRSIVGTAFATSLIVLSHCLLLNTLYSKELQTLNAKSPGQRLKQSRRAR